MGEVTAFTMTRERAKRLISRLAESSSNVTFVNECANGEWEHAVNNRQMLLCLREGEVISDPWWDEKTQTHQCSMERFHAGQDIVLNVAIQEEQSLYVINVCE